MARGNDAAAASAELTTQYGDAPNAEELIDRHRQSQDARLHRASLSQIDQGATDALDLESLPVGDGERVMAAAVRDGYVVAVVEDDRGNFTKRLMDLPDEARSKSSRMATSAGAKLAPPESKPSVRGDGSDEKAAKAADEAAAKREQEAEKDASEEAKASGGPAATQADPTKPAPDTGGARTGRASGSK